MDKNNQINRKSTLIFGLNENGMKSLFKEKFFKYSRSKYFSSTKNAKIFIKKLQKKFFKKYKKPVFAKFEQDGKKLIYWVQKK